MFSYNRNRWKFGVAALVLVSITGAESGRNPQRETGWSNPRRIGSFLKNSIVFEKTMQVQELQVVTMIWNPLSAERTLELTWMTTPDQVSLSFLPQRQPMQRVETSQGALGDQGFETNYQGNRIRELVQGAEGRSAQEDSTSLARVEVLAIDSDRPLPSLDSRREFRAENADAVVFLSQEPPCQAKQAMPAIPLRDFKILRGSVKVDQMGVALPNPKAWLLCREGLELKESLRLDHTVVSFQERQDLPKVLPLELTQPPLSVAAELYTEAGKWTAIPVTWKDGEVLLEDERIQNGSRLRIRYREENGGPSEVRLPQQAEVRDLSLVPSDGCRREDYLIEGSFLENRCRQSSGAVVQVLYPFVHRRNRQAIEQSLQRSVERTLSIFGRGLSYTSKTDRVLGLWKEDRTLQRAQSSLRLRIEI